MYNVLIDKPVLKELQKIPEPDYARIKKAILDLARNPRPAGYKKLKNRPGYRIRQGNYRIIYNILDHKLIIEVISIGHRKDIYE
jgi:mRNA interferase RelE/StbE